MAFERFAEAGLGEIVDTTTLARALYSSDASLYRVVPQAVARPRNTEELVALLEVARSAGIPVTSRGAGTSCAGNAVGPGLVIDLRRLDTIESIDPHRRTAVVQPGVVQHQLSTAAGEHGLLFGPDPSTYTRCTIGGMIGNNACGPRAMGYGRTADNLVALEIVTGAGERLVVGEPDSALVREAGGTSATITGLDAFVRDNLAEIRTGFGRFGRQVSGYSLEHLLPENGAAIHRFLAGSEGTLATILRAEVRLVADAAHKTMVAIGYPDMAAAGDAAVMLARHRPTAAEGFGRRLVDVVRQAQGEAAVPALPAGDGWMFVELVDDDPDRLARRARDLADEAAASATEVLVVDDPAARAALWKIRADGAGLAGVSLDRPAYGGWEDAAVPPASLGPYLRDFDALMEKYGVHGLPYGHFGDGCVHCRIDFPLDQPGGAETYRRFVVEAAELVASYGGSMSGEHGDGRARSELLSIMYTPAQLALFGRVKDLFDPDNHLNPGVLVDPAPVTADLRVPQTLGSPLRKDFGHFVEQVHQCSGVGKCVADNTGTLAVMCPSYQATRDEKDSTRGRARVLQEMVNGGLVSGGFSSPEVHEALDLCLSCKGCARDCPTGIDMAAYKARVLDETYRGRIRPRSHYLLGWLPRWGRLVQRVPGLARVANLGMGLPGLRALIKWSAGVDQRRQLPTFAVASKEARALSTSPARGSTTAAPGVPGEVGTTRPSSDAGTTRPSSEAGTTRPSSEAGRAATVAIWADSFTAAFSDTGVGPLRRVLTAAGHRVEVVVRDACCGLTWISTGQLDGARRQLRHALDVLHPLAEQGIPIIGVEPSCTAVWRSDAAELLPDDQRVPVVAGAVTTLAELLARTPDWSPPDLTGTTIVAQPHCHHAAVLGWQTDAALLRRTGATVTTVGGCCGLAGNFGVEQGHHEISLQVAETALLPAIRTAGSDAVVLADGFSCRVQVESLSQARVVTLAQLLDADHA